MPIDFYDSKNQSTYASRTAEQKWIHTINQNVDIQDKEILDLGCGGGIYSKVFALSGAKHVTAMDFSQEMLNGAKENCRGLKNITFVRGNALDTKLREEAFDVLLERAVIHHIHDLRPCFQEAGKILKTKGKFIIQDRTPTDTSLPGSETHIRGYIFEKYPKLLKKEMSRRYSSQQVIQTLEETGFNLIKEIQYWEIRKKYKKFQELETDLLNRTGRSILYEISDDELVELVKFIKGKIIKQEEIIERDRWTIWIAEKH